MNEGDFKGRGSGGVGRGGTCDCDERRGLMCKGGDVCREKSVTRLSSCENITYLIRFL
jgi:hypothetical protein